jgi:hypothetical protein
MIKKADDYAKIFNEAAPGDERDAVLIEIAAEFAREAIELIRARKCATPVTISSALNEIDDKWRAVSRRCENAFNPYGFRFIVEKTMPEILPFWEPKGKIAR